MTKVETSADAQLIAALSREDIYSSTFLDWLKRVQCVEPHQLETLSDDRKKELAYAVGCQLDLSRH